MLAGNHFTIVLRDVRAEPAALETALAALRARGFVNYFGLQRFGANVDASTHEVGAALLRSDWQQAARLILARTERPPAERTARTSFSTAAARPTRCA